MFKFTSSFLSFRWALLLSLPILGLGSSLWAFPSPDCERFHFYQDKVQVYRQNPEGETCWLSINPDGRNMVYRNYLLDEQGLFMVFNSYGQGANSTHTGARVFYFIPNRLQVLTAKRWPKQLGFQTPSGVLLSLSSETGRWQSSPDGKIQETPTISRLNQGGIELSGFTKALILDAGFSLGRDPRSVHKTSLVQDPEGRRCSLPNQDLYIVTEDQNFRLRFQTARQWRDFLKVRCPELNISVLD